MKKTMTFLFILLITMSIGLWAQGLETFDNMPETGGSYSDGTFTGQDGSTWTYVQCRSDYDVTGNSCMLGRSRTPQANVYSGTISGGIGDLSFNYMQVFTTNVNLNVLVNDVVVGNVTSSTQQGVILSSGTISINVAGNFVIKFINVNNSDGQVCVDDITWTAYSTGANIPPAINNIVQTPAVDIESTHTVSVSADITDSDGTVELAQLQWGTTSGTYPIIINMTLGTGDTYTADTDIPAQATGTTVYYVVYAEDENEGTTSGEQSYTVIAPATTIIPYSETFDADLGDCYTYNVSGATKEWYWRSVDYCAYMSGYNSGDTEEDWLILPGVNVDAYGDMQMSFDTWYQYGNDDANNYLKLYYSTDYYGLGDPTSRSSFPGYSRATWTEISFTHPSAATTWTSSGIIDLSGISGTSVWFAFKYLYQAGSYRNWKVDNILIEEAPEDPVIYVNPSSLSGFTYEYLLGPSAEQSFTVSGVNLIDDITITPPTNYEISTGTDAKAFVPTNPITLTPTGGAVAETIIYVRLKAGLAIGTYNSEVINVSSDGAIGETVTCSGEVTTPPPPDAPVVLDPTEIGPDSFTANWQAVTGATGYYLDVYTLEGSFASDLIISEYIEGGSFNKALEIYNGTGGTVDLTPYKVQLFSNGAATASVTYDLPGTLAHGDVYVIAHSSATAPFTSVADHTVNGGVVNFNGDDAVALYYDDGTKAAYYVDIFGCIGERPIDAWISGSHSTANQTLVRKSTVTAGITTNPATGFPTLESEWDSYPQDTADYLGSHTMSGGTITYVTGYENLNVGNVTSYPVTGLAPNTMYYYVVRAYNDYGTGPNSGEMELPGDGTVPVELSSFTAMVTSENFVALHWTTQSETNVQGYYIYRNNVNDLEHAFQIPALIAATNTSQESNYTFIDEEVEPNNTYYYWLQNLDMDGSFEFHGPINVTINYNDGGDTPPVVPTKTELLAAYPNPFNPMTHLRYSLKEAGFVKLDVYNNRGQLIRSFSNDHLNAGYYQMVWDGKDMNGRSVSSGIYYYRMTSGKYTSSKKVVLLK